MIQRYPANPYVQSRMGRLCLEVGKKQEAQDAFTIVQRGIARSHTPATDQDLEVLNLMNKGYMFIYDGNYKEAIETFRRVLTIKPANILASNNCATCQMYG